MSSELDLGSREKSPELVELTPAIEVERGRLSDVGEANQEIVAEKAPSDLEMIEIEMSEKDPERDNSQGSLDMQAMMNQILQLVQEQKTETKQMEERLKEGQKESEERTK
jgi:hypothetical protein